MRLVDQLAAVEARLPRTWEETRLTVTTEDPAATGRAAAILGPLGPVVVDGSILFYVRRSGSSAGLESVRRLLNILDEERIWSTLERADVREADAPVEPEPEAPAAAPVASASVVGSFEQALATLPEDWSELLCRLEVGGSALLPRAALLCAPINPTRDRDSIGFLFRVGRVGYGVSTTMARRCFERMDEEHIAGAVTVLRALSDTRPVATQGSSWIVGGRVL